MNAPTTAPDTGTDVYARLREAQGDALESRVDLAILIGVLRADPRQAARLADRLERRARLPGMRRPDADACRRIAKRLRRGRRT